MDESKLTNYPKVSVLLPIIIEYEWQYIMTEACIRIMRATTSVPFQLVLVETKSNRFDPRRERGVSVIHSVGIWQDDVDVYIHRPERTCMVRDLNAGLEKATGDYIVHTGNDIFTQDEWLEALLECFEIPDCGAACLAASDMKHEIQDRIIEGIYGPLFMFKAGWRFDEDYTCIASDTDMIMRIYESGQRMYRNWRVLICHFGQVTYTKLYDHTERDVLFRRSQELFTQKHGKSRTLMFQLLVSGAIM